MVINDKLILIGGLEPWNFMTFHVLGIIIPTDLHIFQRGRSTTNKYSSSTYPKSSERPTSNYKNLLFISAYQKGPTRTRVGDYAWCMSECLPGPCEGLCLSGG